MKSTAQILVATLCAALLCSSTALAAGERTPNDAEQNRLRDVMRDYARKNAWKGVEKAFKQMTKLRKVDVCWQDYAVGAEAARNTKQPTQYLTRMWKARAAAKKLPKKCTYKADASKLAEMDSTIKFLKERWARVHLKSKKKTVISFVNRPFAPDLADGAQPAFDAVKAKGKFKGLLLVSKYKASNGKNFEVKSADWKKAEACVKKWDKKKKFKHEKCIKKIKYQTFKVK